MNSLLSIKYQPLSQSTLSDDEDEGFSDNILYDSRLVNGPKMDRRNVFELEKLGQPRIKSPPNVHFQGRGRRTVVIIAVLIVIVLGVAAAVVFPIINHLFNHGLVIDVTGKPSVDWRRVFNNTWTESSLRIVDVDQDNLDDIILGVGDKHFIDHDTDLTMAQFCQSKGQSYPCGGLVMALRGYDGQDIWKSSTRSFTLDTFCGDIDVNKDGLADCIITGRHSTCQAVERRSGDLLWRVDPEHAQWSNHFLLQWNVYRGPSVQDLDHDGVLDFIVLHSRDRNLEFWEHTSTSAGRLIIVSGKTGVPIGKGYFEIPPMTESYMTPVGYSTPSGEVYILYGTGSKQTKGHLMAISLASLYQKVTGLLLSTADDSWLSSFNMADGEATLFSGETKGLTVPPLLVDVNTDGVVDILVVTADANIALLNGKTLQVVWKKTFSDMEISSSPTPGHFNLDETVDVLVHLNEVGIENSHNGKTLILNGVDGTELWSYQGEQIHNSSGLSLRTVSKYQDVFLVKLGAKRTRPLRKIQFFDGEETKALPMNSSQTEDFRNMCDEILQRVSKESVLCEHDLDFLTQTVVLFDQRSAEQPLRLVEEKAFSYHYRLQHKPGDFHCHDLTERHKDKIDMCTVLMPSSLTGGIGDVDGDRSLDYIHVSQMLGVNRSDTMNITGEISNVVISKYNIKASLDKHIVFDTSSGHVQLSSDDSSQQTFQFLPSSSQLWTQYLGTHGNSKYILPDR
ncbi:protein ITFG3-like isoform X1 [Biomphalaria pfeifferi]|uniref:Protein ITFG3-like isoform X1 n=1 Tax=Biomphalaria pfeifferi TaxID=112525 RepID=A0AAD8BKS2_BIOPF|nr:protein ITFG3-like isoform X1 [Biomphalaria pfeifferi]